MEKITLANKYLTFSDESKKLLKPEAVELLIDTFNKVWRGICDFFNNGEIRNVVFETDIKAGLPQLITVIETTTITDDDNKIISIEERIIENNKIKFNPNDQIFQKKPMDIDFITHELVHAAQDYPCGNNCPQWIVEGLADYGREKFGIRNKEGGWSIPKISKNTEVNGNKISYKIGYIITAGFFMWIENNVDTTLLKDLNNTIKSGKYNDNYFFEKTGKTVDELWEMYLNANDTGE